MNNICPIWNEKCTKTCILGKNDIPPDLLHPSLKEIKCLRAGVFAYRYLRPMSRMIAPLDENVKLRLCAEIASQNVVYKNPQKLDEALIRRIKSQAMPLMPKRLDLAIEWLVRHSPRIGARPLLNDSSDSWKNFWPFCAFCYCYRQEATMVLNALKDEKLVAFPATGDFPQLETRVTHKGYARYEELQRKSVASSQVFVAMWFDTSMDAIYKKAIDPAIRDAGYEPVRVDDVQHNRKIDDEIIALIRRSRFVVADFTAGKPEEPRGGVYYEAGFAYGLGREVIYTCRKDFVEALHFDTRQYNHIVWNKGKLSDFRKALRHRIEATIGRGPKTKNDAE